MIKKLSSLLLIVSTILINGCSKSPATAVDYFKETKGNEEDIVFNVEESDAGYVVYADNYAEEDIYISFVADIYDDAGSELAEYNFNLVRPETYGYTEAFEVEPALVEGRDYKFYKIDGPAKFEYGYIYGYTDTFEYIDAYKTDGFTDEEMKNVIKEEYIIALATNYNVPYIFFVKFDETKTGADLTYSDSDLLYRAYIDFEEKIAYLDKYLGNGEYEESDEVFVELDFLKE